MCGLCGIAYDSRLNEIAPRIERMSAAIAHRGPDGSGTYFADGVALGHRRLSILELTDAGAQPMRSLVRDVVIVFNGEIYNFVELRERLTRLGRHFRGRSDTEVVLACYEEWGIAGLERLEGMFAIALWDGDASRLVLVRDRLGIKPLYYSTFESGIVFGSEIKALSASGLVSNTIDRQTLAEYLWFGNAHGNRSIYTAVRSVGPGCRVVWERGRLREERWWAVEEWLDGTRSTRFATDPVRAVRESIETAVQRQSVADVPVGLFLSGGIDSSAIAVAASSPGTAARLTAFSAGFGSFGAVDERSKARRVATRLGIPFNSVEVGEFDLESVVLRMVEAHDEPFADAANVPLFLLSRSISSQAKVVLQGDGGDELFGGYRRYLLLRHLRVWRSLPSWIVDSRWPSLHSALRRVARVAGTLKQDDPAMRMALLLTTDTLKDSTSKYFRNGALSSLLGDADPFLAYRDAASRFRDLDPVSAMCLTDLTVQLPSQFLPKVDRATMASGVEARVPLLDENVCRVALNLPVGMKVHGLRKKIALREMLRGALPRDIVDGPKTGFEVPYAAWLAGPLSRMARNALLDRGFVEAFGVDPQRIEQAFDTMRRGNLADGYKLWKLAQLALWAKSHDHNLQ